MIAIGERPLDLNDARAALAGPISVALSEGARARILRSAETMKRLQATGDAIYGVNTRFGKLAKTCIAANDLDKLKISIVRAKSAKRDEDHEFATDTGAVASPVEQGSFAQFVPTLLADLGCR